VIYLDTSCLLKLYAREQGSEELAAWLTGRSGVVCAGHGRLELISALKRHQREGRLDTRGLRQALTCLAAEEATRLIEWLPVTNTLINTACARVAEMPPTVFIRAGDALHLVAAAEAGLKEIYSHDRHLLAAAPHFGLKGLDVIQPA
jgi:predicted nucleic acid-binding protein